MAGVPDMTRHAAMHHCFTNRFMAAISPIILGQVGAKTPDTQAHWGSVPTSLCGKVGNISHHQLPMTHFAWHDLCPYLHLPPPQSSGTFLSGAQLGIRWLSSVATDDNLACTGWLSVHVLSPSLQLITFSCSLVRQATKQNTSTEKSNVQRVVHRSVVRCSSMPSSRSCAPKGCSDDEQRQLLPSQWMIVAVSHHANDCASLCVSSCRWHFNQARHRHRRHCLTETTNGRGGTKMATLRWVLYFNAKQIWRSQ